MTQRRFDVEGKRYTLEQMLTANADDEAFCEWARTAQPGEFFAAIASCQCVLEGDLSEHDLIEIDRAYEQGKRDGSFERAAHHREMVREIDRHRFDPLWRGIF